MVGTQVLDPAASATTAASAVAWINGREAVVVAMDREGQISSCEINRGWLPRPAYLAQVVRVIGDRQRVAILGPSSVRQALEREYVGSFGRPDHLVDVEPAGRVPFEELVDHLRTLAS
jgi:hypothetical protein